MRETIRIIHSCYFVFMFLVSLGCNKKTPTEQVVVYTSLDKVFSQPILEASEKETGIGVLAVYDTDAAKALPI